MFMAEEVEIIVVYPEECQWICMWILRYEVGEVMND